MTKMTQNLLIILVITDFLLGFGFCSKRLFCRYWRVTCVYRFSYMYMKRSSRRTPLNVYRWRYWAILPHPLLAYIFASSEVCAKFHDFSSMFRPSKMRFILEKKNNNNKYSCKQRWRAQATNAITTPVASGKLCPAGTCIHNIPLAVRF